MVGLDWSSFIRICITLSYMFLQMGLQWYRLISSGSGYVSVCNAVVTSGEVAIVISEGVLIITAW